MKQFPYAQRIIWENDVEQIEWASRLVYSDYSDLYLIKTHHSGVHVGNWRRHFGGDLPHFVSNEHVFHPEEVECWAKI